jgi:hypothetical protein
MPKHMPIFSRQDTNTQTSILYKSNILKGLLENLLGTSKAIRQTPKLFHVEQFAPASNPPRSSSQISARNHSHSGWLRPSRELRKEKKGNV